MHGKCPHWVMSSITTTTAWVAGTRIRAFGAAIVGLFNGTRCKSKVRQGLAVCLENNCVLFGENKGKGAVYPLGHGHVHRSLLIVHRSVEREKEGER